MTGVRTSCAVRVTIMGIVRATSQPPLLRVTKVTLTSTTIQHECVKGPEHDEREEAA